MSTKVACPVHQIAVEAEKVAAAEMRLSGSKVHLTDEDDEHIRRLGARLDALQVRASRTVPESAAGAVYLLIAAFSRAESLHYGGYLSDDEEEEDVEVMERCFHSAVRFFEAAHEVEFPALRRYHMSEALDPAVRLAADTLDAA